MKIVQYETYGRHIPIKCKTCNAIGNTKNISPIGCRTLFINCSCNTYEPIHPKWEALAESAYLERDLFWQSIERKTQHVKINLKTAFHAINKIYSLRQFKNNTNTKIDRIKALLSINCHIENIVYKKELKKD